MLTVSTHPTPQTFRLTARGRLKTWPLPATPTQSLHATLHVKGHRTLPTLVLNGSQAHNLIPGDL